MQGFFKLFKNNFSPRHDLSRPVRAGLKKALTAAAARRNLSNPTARKDDMARIPYYDPEAAEAATREFIDRMPRLNIFRMLGHAGRTGTDFIRLGSSILLRSGLDPALRELAIIRTGILCGSSYEVHQHREIGRLMGLSPEKLDALSGEPSSPPFSDLELLALRYTEEIVNGRRASGETLAGLDGRLGHARLVELTIAIIYYMGVSCFLETFGIEIEKKE